MSTLPDQVPRRRRLRIRKQPFLRFTLVGLTYVGMMLFMGLAAVNSQANLLFGVFGLMIGVLVISAFISWTVLRKLDVRRILPEYVTVNEPACFQYEFHNRKLIWPSLSVTVSELTASHAFSKQPQAYLLHVAARTKATVLMLVVPTRRGLYQFDQFQISTSSPFGFICRARTCRRKDNLLIHPPIAQVDRKLLQLCLSAERSGVRMRPRRGGTDEFYGVREFRHGDNPRWIYWRRSARTGTLVAKEMSQVAPPRLLLIVDTFLADRSPASHAAVEKAIAMAASLVAHSVETGLAVGLHCWAGDWVSILPSRGKRHCRDLLAVLARLPLNQTHNRYELLANAHRFLRSGTTAIFLTPTPTEQSLATYARGNWIVIPSESDLARMWFRFDERIDFEQCMPLDQRPQRRRTTPPPAAPPVPPAPAPGASAAA